ncbi:MAG: hypothetical protein E6R05_01400 [Candidatus Moraniibacteriota bacterium]|nr:MAG: hypothetical protein E6R05_01400 [Candidatus Moranbacteria bacterium]
MNNEKDPKPLNLFEKVLMPAIIGFGSGSMATYALKEQNLPELIFATVIPLGVLVLIDNLLHQYLAKNSDYYLQRLPDKNVQHIVLLTTYLSALISSTTL